MSPASAPHSKFPNWPNPWPQDCLELQIRHDGPACHVAFACGGLAWGRDAQGHIRCADHGGPPGPLVCRACSRPLPVDCCSEECAREQLCEPCAGWSALLVAQGRFLADFERALEAALPSGSLTRDEDTSVEFRRGYDHHVKGWTLEVHPGGRSD